jgi:hypothetical protein
MGFNPFGGSQITSVVSHLVAQASSAFEMVSGNLLNVGDGRKAVRWEVSVGQGRGATRLGLNGDQIGDVIASLRSFDASADPEAMSPAEVVARTIAVEGDAVTFRVTNAKNARTVSIPRGEFQAFIAHLEQVDGWVDGAVAHYRNVAAEVKAEAK